MTPEKQDLYVQLAPDNEVRAKTRHLDEPVEGRLVALHYPDYDLSREAFGHVKPDCDSCDDGPDHDCDDNPVMAFKLVDLHCWKPSGS